MRAKPSPEDKVVGVVLARLKQELGLTYEEMEMKTGIPTSTIAGIMHPGPIGNSGRISIFAKYFQEQHGLSYVDEKYLLNGGPEDQKKIELLKLEEKIKAEAKRRECAPPMLILTGQAV